MVPLAAGALAARLVFRMSPLMVLGGLIDDQLTDGSDSVPLLGQIPLAGALFRYDARHRVKTNLLVFLKPTVVRTAADGRTLTSDRYDYLMGEQELDIAEYDADGIADFMGNACSQPAN